MKTACEELAKLATSVALCELPERVIIKTKDLILDSLGCMIGGIHLGQGQSIVDMFRDMGGAPESTVVGMPTKVPALHAAYSNSYLANLLDYDDTYNGHPGATTIPPALAVAEKVGASGKDLIEAVVVGYEVGIRLSQAMMRSPTREQIVSGFTWQIFNAAAAAGRILGLNTDRMTHCLSFAAYNAPVPFLRKSGLREGKAVWTKNNFGWFSMGGVMAALLADHGFRGNDSIFDGETGFWIMAGSDQFHSNRLTQKLGQDYMVETVSVKPYVGCRYLHPTLDAIQVMIKERDLPPERIVRIDVATFSRVVENFAFYPTTVFDVPFSLPYLVALHLLEIPTGYQHFDQGLLVDPRVRQIAEKVHLSRWAEADDCLTQGMQEGTIMEMTSKVLLTLDSGYRLEEEARIPKGDPRNPLLRDELHDKFRSLVEPVLGRRRAKAMVEVISDLDGVNNLQELTSLLC